MSDIPSGDLQTLLTKQCDLLGYKHYICFTSCGPDHTPTHTCSVYVVTPSKTYNYVSTGGTKKEAGKSALTKSILALKLHVLTSKTSGEATQKSINPPLALEEGSEKITQFEASSSYQVSVPSIPNPCIAKPTSPSPDPHTNDSLFSESSEFTAGELSELDRIAGEKQGVVPVKLFLDYDNILYITFKNYSEFTWKDNKMHVLSRNASYVISRFGYSWNTLVDLATFIGEELSFYHYLFRIAKKIAKYIKDHDITVVFADIPMEIAKHLKFFNTFGEAPVYVPSETIFRWEEL